MTEERNPYAAPKAQQVANGTVPVYAGAENLRTEPLRLPAGAGSAWVGASWELFRKEPATLVLILILYFVVAAVIGMVPVLGTLFGMLAGSVWTAGFMIVSTKLVRDEPIGAGDLFAGFTHPRLGRLILLNLFGIVLGLLALLVIAIPVLLTFGSALIGALIDGGADPQSLLDHLTLAGLFAILLTCALAFFVLIACFYFAPVLVTMHDVGIVDACGLSFRAVTRNWLPLTIYGLIVTGLALASVFTLFLGLLVLVPMMWIAIYLSYRGIFVEAAAG